MKKIVILFILLAPSFASIAQKPIKPSLPKAEKALREGKFDEAKTIIDATTGNQEFMVDKKGQPSKNAARAWYLKALIYAGIDTTKNKTYKSLVENPLAIAKESFEKCYGIEKGKVSYINDAMGIEHVKDTLIRQVLAQYYLNKAVKYYKEDKDYKKAFVEIENTVYFIPYDTTMLMNAGVYFGPAAEELDKSIVYIDQYFARGGKGQDAYIQLVSIYYDKKKDKEKTLEVVRKALKLFPENTEFPKYELNIYLTEKKYDLARKFVKDGIKKNPNDKDSYYLLGGLYSELGNLDSARMAYQKAVDIDNTFFDAQFDLAKLTYLDAKKIKGERDKLGISATDIQKRKVLFDQLHIKYQVALPLWEKCQKLQPDNETVLFTLSEIYGALVMDDKAEIVRKKMKALGYID